MSILVLNSGSSSIKYKLFDADLAVRAQGLVEDVGGDHRAGFQRVFTQARAARDGALAAIGHRVVHGGELFQAPAIVDDAVLRDIRATAPLAPLQNPPNLLGIEIAQALEPGVPQVAVFDTAFHQTLPPRAYRYAVAEELYRDHGVRRYGFHGTSHAYVARRAAQLLGRPVQELRLITLHLGNGASACAIDRGRSVDTSMGMTPLEGLVMGSRCGDLDPAIPLHLARQPGMDDARVDALLNEQSGLKGLCGASDLRDVERRATQGDARAELALDVYCYRIRKYVGAYFAALGGADAVVFTAGVGEHSAEVRRRACEGLEALGIVLDPVRNQGQGERAIHAATSRVALLVVPTDEELEIARQTRDTLRAAGRWPERGDKP